MDDTRWRGYIDTDPQWEPGYVCPRPICIATLNHYRETLCWKCGELVKPFKVGIRYEYTGRHDGFWFFKQYEHEKIIKFLGKSNRVEHTCDYCSANVDGKKRCNNCGAKT